MEYKKNKFNLGDRVVITKTNPGFEGTIVYIAYTFCYDMYPNPFCQWAKIFALSLEDILTYPVYIIELDEERLAHSSASTKTKFFSATELDISSPEEFWSKAAAELETE